jgi:1,2-dihydroxy-3-keto-5-methylthiopentene dioxygenase
MAIVSLPDEHKTIHDETAIREHLASIGIGYERWEPSHALASDAPSEEVLAAYTLEIEKLKSIGGYVTADVIDINPQTPNLEAMLQRFNREHWHEEDEVRFIIRGRGLFHIRPGQFHIGPLTRVEVGPGDLLTVPRGTRHWFDLCADRDIRAIRLFQDAAGWTPYYTESGAERGYEPACFGPSYIRLESSPSRAPF